MNGLIILRISSLFAENDPRIIPAFTGTKKPNANKSFEDELWGLLEVNKSKNYLLKSLEATAIRLLIIL
jgi:hypothetical protein